MPVKTKVDQHTKPYRPYGAAKDVLYNKSDEVFLVGPVGTGKSRACLEKLHICMEKYEGARALMVRRTRSSLTNSGLVTFEDKVVPRGHPILTPVTRPQRHSYVYPNGSEIDIGGLDKPGKIMSTEYDIIYVQEGIELTVESFESLTTRLRNGVIPYQQLIGDTNPGPPSHWLRKRNLDNITQFLPSLHEDNPVLWDHEKNTWTEFGLRYVEKLDRLTGARLQRLRYGRWAAAEGQIYATWDTSIHCINRKDLPTGWRNWPTSWAVDFGYSNPFVWQEWLHSPDGDLYRNKEIYFSHRLVEDHCRRISILTVDRPTPMWVAADHDAEDRATFERKTGIKTLAAYKKVKPGIQAVQERLEVTKTGKPRIFFVTDALDEVDESLEEEFKPYCTEQEFDGYIWDDGPNQEKHEYPVKQDDHGMDTTRYTVAQVDLKGRRKLKIFRR